MSEHEARRLRYRQAVHAVMAHGPLIAVADACMVVANDELAGYRATIRDLRAEVASLTHDLEQALAARDAALDQANQLGGWANQQIEPT